MKQSGLDSRLSRCYLLSYVTYDNPSPKILDYDALITVRFTDEQKDRILDYCERHGQRSMSALVRLATLKFIDEPVETLPKKWRSAKKQDAGVSGS